MTLQIKNDIEKIEKILLKIEKINILLTKFWKFFLISIEIIKKILLSPKYIFLLLILVIFLNLIYQITLMNISILKEYFSWQNNNAIKIFFAWIGFLFLLGILIYHYFGKFFQKSFSEFLESYRIIKKSFSTWLNFENNNYYFLSFAFEIPYIIGDYNYDIEKNFWNFLQNSSEILKNIEKISRFQKILPIFFEKNYINIVNELVFEEIKIFQKIINFSLENQINEHNKIIFSIENIEKNEWKNFSEILNLQKIRLEKQKEIFQNLL